MTEQPAPTQRHPGEHAEVVVGRATVSVAGREVASVAVEAAVMVPDEVEDESALRSIGDYRLIALLVGALATGIIAWFNPDRLAAGDRHDKWVIYAMIAVVLGAVAGEAFGFGIARWREIRAIRRIRIVTILPTIAVVIALAVGLLAVAPQFVGNNVVTSRGWWISLIAVVGALPTAAALAGIERVASKPLPGSVGAQLSLLMHLRRTLSRLLNQLGLLVILVMAVNGAAWMEQEGNNAAIFSGAVGSLIVGAMYVPAATTLRRRSSTFVARHFSIANVPHDQLVDAAEGQGKLEKLLGLDQTTFSEMKAGLVILTPFVASALTTFVKF
ncbi:hypothetical protein F4553_004547 [Allocatelliglobosispora scoriae]|uniref:Uncharacterized protein n=1 Tax=Allocatelliglobosispora scoriae TaxID=643052 RepID=A0A841BUP1_9ACTN|nr:hypothetical protein [Allocatelliglobosispora scoriae]MBB5871168.1 hypothetical protein [Allocatelliglobosispora scoriae]